MTPMNRIKHLIPNLDREQRPPASDPAWLEYLCRAIVRHIALLKQIKAGETAPKAPQPVNSRLTSSEEQVPSPVRQSCSIPHRLPIIVLTPPRVLRLARPILWRSR